MQTRSQAKKIVAIAKVAEPDAKEPVAKDPVIIETPYRKPLYDVDIDFDEASIAWRANKKSIGNGQFKYKKWTKLNN